MSSTSSPPGLTPDVVAVGTLRGIGTPAARVVPFGPGGAGFTARLVDLSGGSGSPP